MFLARRPSGREVERFVAASAALPLSYEPIGLAQRGGAGFRIDEQTTIVGQGDAAFARATTAITAWKHFELGWVELFPKGASLAAGTVVGVLMRHLGFYSLNGCRIVYPIGDGGGHELGFAYGTLTNHAEAGEEIFSVSISRETGAVSYHIRAASRPRAPLARLGYPVTRALQARFRRDSACAVARAVISP